MLIQNKVKSRKLILLIVILSWIVLPIYIFFLVVAMSPSDFPVPSKFVIKSGTGVSTITEKLKKEHYIRSPFMMKLVLKLSKRDGKISSGVYRFEEKLSLLKLIDKLTEINYDGGQVTVVIPEGTDNNTVAYILNKFIEDFDKEKFLTLVAEKEGFLFPDTYHFSPTATPEEVIAKMEKNFTKHLKPLQDEIKSSPYSLKEVITLASILEEEGNDEESRRMIMGILANRLKLGMPLQVDATFLKINGKNTYELSMRDLRENKSPYNTYLHKGLPPGPISNPGLESIEAVLNPIPSDYLFYLTGSDGKFYYAKDFNTHKQNKYKYMK